MTSMPSMTSSLSGATGDAMSSENTLSSSAVLSEDDARNARDSMQIVLESTGYWDTTTAVSDPTVFVISSGMHHVVLPLTIEGSYVIVEPNTKVTIVEETNACVEHENCTSPDCASPDQTNHVRVGIVVGQGAEVRYLTNTRHKCTRLVYLQRGAQLIWIDATTQRGQGEMVAYLAGTGASARLSGIIFGTDVEHQQSTMRVIHAASHTESTLFTRAVLLGKSVCSYRGLIKVLADARSCNASQRAETLLLGEGAKMDAMPVLEIANNDVRCSHGVSISQINEDQLFYFESRGMSRQQALPMIIAGFFDPLLISMGEQGCVVRDSVRAIMNGSRASTVSHVVHKEVL